MYLCVYTFFSNIICLKYMCVLKAEFLVEMPVDMLAVLLTEEMCTTRKNTQIKMKLKIESVQNDKQLGSRTYTEH